MAKELFANTKNKIVPFDQDGEFFYRRAKKFEEHNDYIEALNYYRKAVEKDPDNIEYMLNLAETFTEMNCFHESNRILFSMIHSEEVVPDCYFGLGCNFLGLQDFDRAKESFEKYLEVDEFGMYAHDAFDLIHILENQNIFVMPSHDLHEDDEEIYELANNGRMLIDRGEYKEGIKQLEKVLTKNPKVTFAKNNLALAYFCNGEIEKAIDTSKEILRVEPRNIHAICNLTIFLYETGEKQKAREYVKTLTNITPTDGEDIHKIASTLCELKKHSDAYRYLKMLLQYKPYEIKVLHYTAVAAFNLQKFNEALIYWDKIEKIAPNNTISSFYRRYVIDIIKGAVEWREISYNYQVTYEEMINRIKKINKYMNMPKAEFKRQWEVGSTLYTLLSWGVTLNDNGIKKSILLTVGRLGDKAAEKFLKDFLLRENETEGLKRDALAILKHINASEPYIAYINDKLVEVRVNIEEVDEKSIPKKYRNVFKFTVDSMDKRYEEGYREYIQAIWYGYITTLDPEDLPRIQKVETWAATLEYYYCRIHDIDITKKEVASHYAISTSSIDYNLKRLKKATDRKMYL